MERTLVIVATMTTITIQRTLPSQPSPTPMDVDDAELDEPIPMDCEEPTEVTIHMEVGRWQPGCGFFVQKWQLIDLPIFLNLIVNRSKIYNGWHGMTNCFDRAEKREMLRILSERYKRDRLPHAFLHAPNLAYQFNFNLQSRRGYFNLFTTTGVFMSFKYLRN